ncbi:RICIN domain-containing protein [Kitasatospora sp. NBC_01287]|uniref:RICIN domain-containing protein n=1 Tax=Kitasatospora sp. NBC_01287 TaxID=2903573 RepID=UPI00225359D6|nr:RICIN domain-containing protein [Kitasatospora sp. NBC_01287]MCX4751309.1 RICIN domain-containing protein [Kitasatospora sp. NBC_01287]
MTLSSRSADRVPRRGDWLTQARRSRRTEPRSGPAPRADHGLWTVDRALRVLATACARENRGVPLAHLVVVGPEAVRLRLNTPDERPPAGWTAEDGGRTWQARLRLLQSASVAESLEDPYPRLVSLGATGQGFMLLNLGQAGGIINLEGDARQARALALEWSRQLTSNPWSRDVPVVRVGFRPGTAERFGPTGAPAPTDGETALADESGGVALLAGMPGGRDRERIHRLADDPRGRWSVVVVGRVDHPRWRFTIDATGVVDTGLLDEPVVLLPSMPSDEPDHADAAADPVGAPAGKTPPGGRPRGRLISRRRLIVATALLACLVGAALVLTRQGAASHAAPPARAGGVQGASGAASTPDPTASTAPPRSAPASAAGTLLNPGTGKCLSGSTGTDGTPLVLGACDGAANQQWTAAPDGTVRTKGLCMDAAWGATTPGTVVQVANCSGNPAQQFSFKNGTVFSTRANLCAGEVNGGTAVQLLPCDQSAPEVFKRG